MDSGSTGPDGIAGSQRDAEIALPPRDAGSAVPDGSVSRASDAGVVIALPLAQQLTDGVVDAVALAADQGAVYWLSSADELWSLPVGAVSPQRLATNAGAPPGSCCGAALLTTAGDDVFWSGAHSPALHRTAKDGSADAILVSPLNGPTALIADDSRVYWVDVGDSCFEGAEIRALSLAASPGEPPTLLFKLCQPISSLAVQGGTLYWTPYDYGATVYYSSLMTGSVAQLLAGGTATAVNLTTVSPNRVSPNDLLSVGSDLYFGYQWHEFSSAVAELQMTDGTAETISILPSGAFVVGLALVPDSSIPDEWLVASAGVSAGDMRLYVTTVDGGGMVLAAVDLKIAAVAGPAGATFVDTSGRLLVLSPSALEATLFADPR